MKPLVAEGIVSVCRGQAVCKGLDKPVPRILHHQVVVAAHRVIPNAERIHQVTRLKHGGVRLFAGNVTRGKNEVGRGLGKVTGKASHNLRHHAADDLVVPLPIKDAGEMGIGNLYKTPHDHPVP